jgi:uncharacterized small protein (DUF1192 family)
MNEHDKLEADYQDAILVLGETALKRRKAEIMCARQAQEIEQLTGEVERLTAELAEKEGGGHGSST